MSAADARRTVTLAAMAVFLVFARNQTTRLYKLPYPPFRDLIRSTGGALQDASFITFGFRALAADVAWVQLLQNMGDFGHAEEDQKPYPFLKDEVLRVTRIDPYFRSAYLFGAATLAWLRSTNRPDEALEVLREGITYNPTYWPLRTYAAGIGYTKSNQRDKMIRMLEDALRDPDCPTTVKSILANAYKAEKRYPEALAIWQEILSSEKGRDYHVRARQEIPEIERLMAERR